MFIESRDEARDYGSPTGHERCVVTTYPVQDEQDLNHSV